MRLPLEWDSRFVDFVCWVVFEDFVQGKAIRFGGFWNFGLRLLLVWVWRVLVKKIGDFFMDRVFGKKIK